jgi:hypothetical protein
MADSHHGRQHGSNQWFIDPVFAAAFRCATHVIILTVADLKGYKKIFHFGTAFCSKGARVAGNLLTGSPIRKTEKSTAT